MHFFNRLYSKNRFFFDFFFKILISISFLKFFGFIFVGIFSSSVVIKGLNFLGNGD